MARKLEKTNAVEVNPNPPPGTMITAADLAVEMRRSPISVRAALRLADIQKPSGRWKWPAGSKELRKARKALGLAV